MIKRIIAILALLIFTIDCNGLTLAIEPTDLKNVEIPIIDAHSQIPFQAEKLKKIINLMDRGGVACVILSSKGPLTAKALASFALKYPGRILPAVRTKCRAYRENKVTVTWLSSSAVASDYFAFEFQKINAFKSTDTPTSLQN